MKFSSTLKELREQNHVTQNQLASHLKLTRSTIAGYETKGKQPDYERLLQIADYFHVSVDYLLAGSETNGISVPPDSSEYRLLCVSESVFGFQTTAFRIHRISTRSGYKKGKDAKINCAFFPFFFNFYSPPSLLAVNHPRQNVTIPTTIVNTESPLQSTFNKIAIGDARIRPMIA